MTGDDVMIGPAKVGSVQSIGLSPNGLAEVKFSVDEPMHDGTVVRIYENSLSGIANRYVVLEPGPADAPADQRRRHDPPKPHVLVRQPRPVVQHADPEDANRPSQTSSRARPRASPGKAPQANQTLQYFAPALASTSDVTGELARNEPPFDSLLVQGAQTMQALGSRTDQLTELVANTNTTTAAIASQSQNLEQALQLSCRADADPLDRAPSPACARRSTCCSRWWSSRSRTRAISPEFVAAAGQVHHGIDPHHRQPQRADPQPHRQRRPDHAAAGDAGRWPASPTPAFPRMIKEFNDSQPQVDYFREYTPDVVAALDRSRPDGRLLRRQRPLRPHAAVLRRFRARRRPTS